MALTGYSDEITIVNAVGVPQLGVTVAVTGPNSYSANLVSDASTGNIRIGPVPIGDYTVTFGGRSATYPVLVSAADENNAVRRQLGASVVSAARLPFFNVMDYGAVGDGVTDDTAAINATYTAATGTKGTVFFPGNNFATTGTVTIPAQTVTVGSGIIVYSGSGTAVQTSGNQAQVNLTIQCSNSASTVIGFSIPPGGFANRGRLIITNSSGTRAGVGFQIDGTATGSYWNVFDVECVNFTNGMKLTGNGVNQANANVINAVFRQIGSPGSPGVCALLDFANENILTLRCDTFQGSVGTPGIGVRITGNCSGAANIVTIGAEGGTNTKTYQVDAGAIQQILIVQDNCTVASTDPSNVANVTTSLGLLTPLVVCRGNLSFGKHFLDTSGAAPGAGSINANAGAGASMVVTGSDLGGQINIITGVVPAAGVQGTVLFLNAYGTTPRGVQLTPANAAAAGVAANIYVPALNATGFNVQAVAALAASTNYAWFYHVDPAAS